MKATVGSSDSQHVVDEVVALLAGSPQLEAFARRYLRRVPRSYLVAREPKHLAHQVRELFEFIEVRPPDEFKVRVFQPDDCYEGNLCGVVEVVAPDMAFLVDSVTNELQREGYTVEHVFHPVLGINRDDDGTLLDVLSVREARSHESVQHYELNRGIGDGQSARLVKNVARVLSDVQKAVADFEPMQRIVDQMIVITRQGGPRYEQDEINEDVAFLRWLLDDNFVFLGYREYQIEGSGDDRMVSLVPGSGLGILSEDDESRFAAPRRFADLPPDLQARYEDGFLLVITKTNSVSRVHRPARMDYMGVRQIGAGGQVIGEARLLGLFTSKAYMTPADSIPVLRRKLQNILDAEDAIAGSHHHKAIVQLFNSFPKDELFSSSVEDLRESIIGLIEIQEREELRLFVRPDLLQRNVSILMVVPRDRFSAELRMSLQDYFKARFGGESIDYRLSLGETGTARLHFTVWTGEAEVPDVPPQELEQEILALTMTWAERVEQRLIHDVGHDRGSSLAERWAQKFPDYYQASTPLETVIGDVLRLDELESGDGPLTVGLLHEERDGEPLTRLSVYRSGDKLELSEIMPTLEAFGLRVVEEVPTRLVEPDDHVFIHDFGVLDGEGDPLDLGTCGDRVAAAVKAVLIGADEADSLSRLIVTGGLRHDQVGVLRAYRTYWKRVGAEFTVEYINDALAAHPEIGRELIDLFEARFDPSHPDPYVEGELLNRISDRLDAVESLDEDRILRGFLSLILATVRTNVFQPGAEVLAFKFDSRLVPAMPEPAPFREIFVYSMDVEGVHLRGGRVARGGIRWSERKEDYRTEVLGLMKAQMTKNAVIVPNGAKGGFVLRRGASERPTFEEVRAAYKLFIRGLLDVTDNLVDGKVVPPEAVKVHDGDDPYLVVAADRGTAQFSDTANDVAAERSYWLGDAFASGGSAGYDHKALGITARGAWESVKWHLRELGIEPETEPFTVIGIGDMSGDVFSNGMLVPYRLKLVAAFDHRHIFLDPDPDSDSAVRERQRLAAMETSSWADYDDSLISEGGGVFSRAAKLIRLSPQARAVLDTDTAACTPNELIKAILRAPVDLLWNGGIGTYVRASTETDEQAGDRTNDGVRITALDLRTRAVGEGGNLGMTQLARIEYAQNGGLVNTDFIDNSGGVNCSDREVNLKILLGVAMERGDLDRRERDDLIRSVAGDIVDRVLYDNFLQAQILAQEVEASPGRLEAYDDFMGMLEAEGLLDRELEHLPRRDDINERGRRGAGLTAPELAVLVAYAKNSLREWLVSSALLDELAVDDEFAEYFPAAVVTRFGHLMKHHPLRTDLVATMVANEVVNSEGITFVSRLMSDTGCTAAEVVREYRAARTVTNADGRWNAVEQLVGHIPPEVERMLLSGIDRLVESVTRWHLARSPAHVTPSPTGKLHSVFDQLEERVPQLGPESWREQRAAEMEKLLRLGVPESVAVSHAYSRDLAHAPDIAQTAIAHDLPVDDVARLFLLVGPAFEIDWLEEHTERLPATSRWHRQAVQAVHDDLALVRRQLAEAVLASADGKPPEAALDAYLVSRVEAVGRLSRFVRSLASEGVDDVASVIVAIRRIRALTR